MTLVEEHGDFWRGISYIGAAVTLDVVDSIEQARRIRTRNVPQSDQ